MVLGPEIEQSFEDSVCTAATMEKGFGYKNTEFHRVVPNFVLQARSQCYIFLMPLRRYVLLIESCSTAQGGDFERGNGHALTYQHLLRADLSI